MMSQETLTQDTPTKDTHIGDLHTGHSDTVHIGDLCTGHTSQDTFSQDTRRKPASKVGEMEKKADSASLKLLQGRDV